MILNLVVLWLNRNVVYRVYLRNTKSSDMLKVDSMFKKKSPVILFYDKSGRAANYFLPRANREPYKNVLLHRNLIKDNYKLTNTLKYQPFANVSGIVKKAAVALPLRPRPEEIKKYKIIVIE